MEIDQRIKKVQVKLIELFKEFQDIAKELDIQYIAYFGTLLGAIRHKGFIPWDDDLDLVLDYESYLKIKAKYPEKIKDNLNSNNFLLFPKFSNCDENDENATFIDLFVLTKTNQNNIKKYLKFKNKIGYIKSFSKRKIHKKLIGYRMLKPLLSWSWMNKKFTLDRAYNILKDDQGDIQHIIHWPFKKVTNDHIFDLNYNFFDTVNVPFDEITIPVPKNYLMFLEKQFGKNWHIPIRGKYSEHFGMYDLKIMCKK